MPRFHHQHHQIIESALSNFDADFFCANGILFGGGTRIALEIDEYRESVDIDFLCPTRESYRAVREQVNSVSLGGLVHQDFVYEREIRADRDGVRTWIVHESSKIKVEFVSFNEYNLTSDESEPFSVPCISQTSCFVTKLLANTDRALGYPYKDIFDILAMVKTWGPIPEEAMAIAHNFYGKRVKEELISSLEHILDNPEKHYKAARAMLMKEGWPEALIEDEAVKLHKSLTSTLS